MESPTWLDTLILRSAADLEAAGKTRFALRRDVEKILKDKPIQPWELDQWARGVRLGLIRLEGHFFRIGTGKRGALSFFVRNEQGLLVGLRRESVTQAATYVTLITDFGYPRESTRFETGWMDVAVFRPDGQALIYAENKASASTLRKLCERLQKEFAAGVPFDPNEEEPKDDAVNKAQHIWRHRPDYFWAVSPTTRLPFGVRFGRVQGFTLEPLDTLPNSLDW